MTGNNQEHTDFYSVPCIHRTTGRIGTRLKKKGAGRGVFTLTGIVISCSSDCSKQKSKYFLTSKGISLSVTFLVLLTLD